MHNVLTQDVMFKSFSCENGCQTLFLYLSIVALGLGKHSRGLSYWVSILWKDSAQPKVGALALNFDFFVDIKVTQDR